MAGLSERVGRVLAVLVALAAYAALFLPLYDVIDGTVAALTVVPVALAGALLGLRGAALFALVSLPLNAALFTLSGDSTPNSRVGAAIAALSVFVAGGAVGRARDLRDALRSEVAERQRATLALSASERQLSLVVRNVPVVLFHVDRDERVVFAEGKELGRLGLVAAEIVGRPIGELFGDRREPRDALRRAFAGEEASTKLRFAGVSLELEFEPLRDARGMVAGAIGVAYDISESERMQDLLAHRATHDPLTGLPNRSLLSTRMTEAVRDPTGRAALLVLDLDRFKPVNDGHGHEAGDELLKLVGERMTDALGPNDLVARLGGDEFAVLVPRAERDGALRAATALRAALERPFSVGGCELRLSASVGIALFPEHGEDPDALLRRADLAMYAAKRSGAGQAVAET